MGVVFVFSLSPLVGLIYVSVLEGHSRRGAPLPFFFFFFYVKSACPQHDASVIKLYHADRGRNGKWKKSATSKGSFSLFTPIYLFYFLIILLKLKALICEIFFFLKSNPQILYLSFVNSQVFAAISKIFWIFYSPHPKKNKNYKHENR